jgi:thioredoxin-like negative regulator of GroEL
VQKKNERTFNFVWIDAQRASEFVDTWNLASGYPSVVVFNHKKQSIVPYIGAFAESSINEFLTALLRGAKKAIPITKVPSIQAVTQKDEL